MAKTVFANARGVEQEGGGGMSSTFPDVCKTPVPVVGPVPVPYANIIDGKAAAGNEGAKKTQKKIVSEAGKKGYRVDSATQYSLMTRSSGDEAAGMGGIVSMGQMQKSEFAGWSFDVKISGGKLVRRTALTAANRR